MLISHEVPISLLTTSLGFNDYNYCLVHLLETHNAYKEFYKASVTNGKELLLDNSIFELGKAFDPEKFAGWIEYLNPTYYVVPDSLENCEETIQNFKNFVSTYKQLNGAKIGAVQGKTYNELVECYKFMADNCDYIALSFDLSFYQNIGTGTTKLQKQCSGRQRFISMLIEDSIIRWDMPHHLLGCSLAKEFAWYREKGVTCIRSCDTSNPIVSGIEGLYYNGTFGMQIKPTTKLIEYIDHTVTDIEKFRIMHNVNYFRKIVNG